MSRKSEFTATVTKAGYHAATVTVTHKTSGAGSAGMAGNVLIGGLIGIGVDAYTGATQDLTPNPVNLVLEPLAPVAAKAPASPVAEAAAPAAVTADVPAGVAGPAASPLAAEVTASTAP